tara:strand:- start:791 stop:1003 length:213 start_codon:yes stop_codon:yes gene_type:complete
VGLGFQLADGFRAAPPVRTPDQQVTQGGSDTQTDRGSLDRTSTAQKVDIGAKKYRGSCFSTEIRSTSISE